MPLSHIDGLASFITASPSSFHAARAAADLLVAAGFTELAEADEVSAEPGGYVLVRDGSVLAWRIPERLSAPSFRIIGAHTDSPGFVLKPHPTSHFLGWQQAGMEVYGGPLPNSWLDRDFGLAGRLVTAGGEVRLVATGPLLRIPQVAPHLDRSVHGNWFSTGSSICTQSSRSDVRTATFSPRSRLRQTWRPTRSGATTCVRSSPSRPAG